METVKLYSPLSFYIRDNDKLDTYIDNSRYDWRESLPQNEAVSYLNQIQQFIQQGLDPEHGVIIGLVEDFKPEYKEILKKIHSLWPTVEEHSGRLWLATTISSHVKLTAKEIDRFKTLFENELLSGASKELQFGFQEELVTGWGYKLDKTPFAIERGQLFIKTVSHPIESSEYFHYKRPLIDKMTQCFSDFKNSLIQLNNQDLIEYADRIKLTTDAYEYFADGYFYEYDEITFLSRFENPLNVVTELWERFDKDWKNAIEYPDREFFDEAEDYTIDINIGDTDIVSLKQQFFERISGEYSSYQETFMGLETQALIDKADEILLTQDAYQYFTKKYDFSVDELYYLLDLVEPFAVMVEQWGNFYLGNADILENSMYNPPTIFDVDTSNFPFADGKTATKAITEQEDENKDSVLQKIRGAKQLQPKASALNKEIKTIKSGPEI